MNTQPHPNRRKFVLRWGKPFYGAMRAELDVLVEQEVAARVAELEAALKPFADAVDDERGIEQAISLDDLLAAKDVLRAGAK